MSEHGHGRRATAEVRWSGDPGAIAWVGERPLHHYWPLLSPYFRDVLLPPHRRAEEDAVAWHWQEPADTPRPTPAELATIRKRLAADQQTFADSLTRRGAGEAAAGQRGHADLDQLGAVMASVTARLNARSNAELALFVCRGDAGLRLHSWGATTPAQPTYPDERQREVSGVVIVAARPAPGHEVVLEEDGGGGIARVRADAAGCFRFSNVAAATYRLRVVSGRVRFPADGVRVDAGRGSVTGIELRSADDRGAPAAVRTARRRIRPRWIGWSAAAGLAIAGAAWAWRSRPESRETKTETSVAPAVAAPASAAAPRVASASAAAPAAGSRSVVRVQPAAAGARRERPDDTSDAPPQAIRASPHAGTAAASAGGAPGAVSENAASAAIDHALAVPAPASTVAPASPEPLALPVSPEPAELPEKTPKRAKPAPANLRQAGARPAEAATETKRDAPAVPRPERPDPPRSESRTETLLADTPEVKPDATEKAADALPVAAIATPTSAATEDDDNTVEPAPRPRPTSHRSPPPAVAPAPSPPGEADDARADTPRPAPFAWRTIVRLRIPAWRTRLMVDAILPTQPLPVGVADRVAAIQAELLRTKTAQVPISFREPVVMFGCTFDVVAEAEWQHRGDARPLLAGARAGTAEVGWAAAPASLGARSVLRRRDDGRVLAEFSCEADGAITVRAADGVAARPWVAVAIAPADDARRFAWEQPPAGARPPPAADPAGEPRFLRCPLPIAATAHRAIALCDRETLWALTADAGIAVETIAR